MALKEVLADLNFRVDQRQLQNADTALGNVLQSARNIGQALAGAFAVGQIASWVTEQARAADRVGDTAQALQVNAQALQEMRYAAQIAGVETSSMDRSLSLLTRNLGMAAQGNKGASLGFRRLGISIRDSEGNVRSSTAVMADAADAIAALPVGAERAAAAIQIFGRSGMELLPLLSRGSAGVRELSQEFRDLDGGWSDEALAESGIFTDRLDALKASFTGLKSTVLVAVLPILNSLFLKLKEMAGPFIRLIQNSRLLESGLAIMGATAIALGARILRTWMPVIRPFLRAAGAALLLWLVLDDIMVWFEGGDSLIGRFQDRILVGMFGLEGSSMEAAEGARLAWSDFSNWMSRTVPEAIEGARLAFSDFGAWIAGWGERMFGFWQDVGQAFNNLFLQPIADGFVEFRTGLDEWGENVRTWWSDLWTGIVNGFQNLVIQPLGDLLSGILNPINAVLRGLGVTSAPPRTAAVTPRSNGGPVTVNGGNNIQINGAQNPAAVGQQVAAATSRENERLLREIQRATGQRAPAA